LIKPVDWINIPASLISLACMLLLLAGVRESKFVTNFITAIKMMVVGLMVIGGFALFQPNNLQPPLAPRGLDGVLRGATSSFFGYLGYDEICVVAGEAKHPKRDLPKAVMGTLIIVTVCYVLGAIALTGMLPYEEISVTSGFPEAFASRGWTWAAQLSALGEVATLPVVVLISLLAQPRLTYAMAKDGILPRSIFAPTENHGESALFTGTLVSGVIMTVIAALIPFTYLDDLISSGILVAFSMTNSALIQFRCISKSRDRTKKDVPRNLIIYHSLCFLTALSWNHDDRSFEWTLASLFLTSCWFFSIVYLCYHFPSHSGFSGLEHSSGDIDEDEGHDQDQVSYFETPFVPLIPCLGIAMNWYLISQLESLGLCLLTLYLGTCLGLYYFFCNGVQSYERVCETSSPDGIGSPLGIDLGPQRRSLESSSSAEELRSLS
jgi:APA family basic amino acid/polyamine antiporter